MNEEKKRKTERAEKKKKKIAAYLEVAKLNEEDRKARKNKPEEKPALSKCTEDIPAAKRVKTDNAVVSVNNPTVNPLLEEVNQNNGHCCPNLADPNPDYNTKDITELRRLLRERRKKFSQIPKFRLKESGELASLFVDEDHRIPLFMVDVQHLIMWSLLGHHAPFEPSRWYQLLKYNKLSHTVVLAVDGISVNDLQSAAGFLRLPSPRSDDGVVASVSVPPKLFPWKLEFIGPLSYGSNLVQELATVPLSNTQYEKVIKMYGSIEKALKGKAVYKVFRSMFPVQSGVKKESADGAKKDSVSAKERNECIKGIKDKFPRMQLLLSPDQMIQIGYPVPLVNTSSDYPKQPMVVPNEIHETKSKIAGSVGTLLQSTEFLKHFNSSQIQGYGSPDNPLGPVAVDKGNNDEENEADEELYVFTKPQYKEVEPTSPMFAVDCEMCQTGERRSELTRISVINENLEVVYESLVKPYRKITNYLTRFSGITEKMLKGVKTRLKDVQNDIQNLLPPDAILVGQSLNFDLHAMKMMHPYVIDTSVAYNLSGDRSRRTKLATLSRLFLSENIQCSSKGHDSIEDASAAMKLVLLKLSKSITFGDAVLSDKTESEEGKGAADLSSRRKKMIKDSQVGVNGAKIYATSVFNHVTKRKHAAAVVGVKGIIKEYETYISEGKSKRDSVDLGDNEVKSPAILSFESSSEVITHACAVMLEHQLCIVHIDKDSVGEKLKTLKNWCKKIVEHSAPCSLCIVVLGGTGHSNGACLINLKGPSAEVT